MADMEAYERDIGSAHIDYFMEFLDRMNEARAGVAAVLGTDVGAVALTHATTDGMNAATLVPDWRTGGRAVTTAHEHPGALGPLYALRDRYGIDLAFVEAGDDGDDARTIAAFERAITTDTRLVSISHVLWTTGAVLPVRAIAEIAHDRGALVVVDGAQAAGAILRLEISVSTCTPSRRRSGCSARRMEARRRPGRGRGRPCHAGGYSASDGRRTGRDLVARRPPSRPADTIGLGRRMARRSAGCRCRRARRPPAARPMAAAGRPPKRSGVTVLTPRHAMDPCDDPHRGLAGAGGARRPARDLPHRADHPDLDALRLSVGFFTMDDELDRVAEAIELLASHTPETLPRGGPGDPRPG
jgi:L-cysteine/cystine lyase